MLEYGNSGLANGLEKVIDFGEKSMTSIMGSFVMFCMIFLTLNIVYEIFLLAGDLDLGEVIKKVLMEILIGIAIITLLQNWMPVLNNVIIPLFLKKIPSFIFGFGVNGNKLWEGKDIALLNLDALWSSLKEIPDRLLEHSSGLLILIGWVVQSNLGIFLSFLALKIIAWFIILFMFADIMQEVLMFHIIFLFSGVLFPLMTFKPFRDNYGFNLIQALLMCIIQYYMLFLLVGIITGFMNYIAKHFGDNFIYILALILLKGMFSESIKVIHNVGSRM